MLPRPATDRILETMEKNMSAEERLEALGIELPEPPKPVANYVTNMIVDRCLYVSGHGPAPL